MTEVGLLCNTNNIIVCQCHKFSLKMYNLINFPHFQADKMSFTLAINGILAIASFILTLRLIPGLKNMFIKANLSGLDMSKPIEGKKKM